MEGEGIDFVLTLTFIFSLVWALTSGVFIISLCSQMAEAQKHIKIMQKRLKKIADLSYDISNAVDPSDDEDDED